MFCFVVVVFLHCLVQNSSQSSLVIGVRSLGFLTGVKWYWSTCMLLCSFGQRPGLCGLLVHAFFIKKLCFVPADCFISFYFILPTPLPLNFRNILFYCILCSNPLYFKILFLDLLEDAFKYLSKGKSHTAIVCIDCIFSFQVEMP